MSSYVVLVGVPLLVAAGTTWRVGRSPLAAGLWLWLVTAVLYIAAPLRLPELTAGTQITAGIGILALAAPAWLSPRPPMDRVYQGAPGVSLARLLVCSFASLGMVILGVYAFRSGVAAATGQGFADLSAQQVRSAQSGAARGGGLLALLSALNPLLVCLGVYGGARFSRWWLVLVVIGVAASFQTPARLTTISLVLQGVVFYLYMGQAFETRVKPSRGVLRRHPLMTAAAGVSVCAGLFIVLGNRLGKNSFVQTFYPGYPWPGWTLSPILYFTGGMPAFSVARAMGFDPFQHPNSIYTLARAWAVVDPAAHAPDALGLAVNIGLPFNVYSGFGQIYFDFGNIGVAVLCALLGWIAVASHRRAMAGRVEWAWVASLVATLLLSLPQAYRLFFLDVDFQLVAGFAMFAWIRRARSNRRVAVEDVLSQERDARPTVELSPAAPRRPEDPTTAGRLSTVPDG